MLIMDAFLEISSLDDMCPDNLRGEKGEIITHIHKRTISLEIIDRP